MPVIGMPGGLFSAPDPRSRRCHPGSSVSDALTDYVEVLAQQTITDQVRAGGSFAPARQVAESASSLERLVAFTGRPVHV